MIMQWFLICGQILFWGIAVWRIRSVQRGLIATAKFDFTGVAMDKVFIGDEQDASIK